MSIDGATLPVWDLGALYPAYDSPLFAHDMARGLEEAQAFEGDVKGQVLGWLAHPEGPSRLADAIERYERLDDLIGRLMSYAVLFYSENTTDPVRMKFYADVQERVTAITSHLLFFTLEINRIEDVRLEQAVDACDRLKHYQPWLEDLRRERPYQLEDRVEQLFHEKSVTAAGAWNRLFDETLASLTFRVGEEELRLEPTLSLLQDPDVARRKMAAEALGKGLADHLRVFTLILNVLAKDKEISDRWRGFGDVAAARHLANRIEPEVVEALVSAVRAAYPRLSHRYYRLKARWFGVEALDFWDRNAPLPDVASHDIGWAEAQSTVLEAFAGFSGEMAAIAQRFFDENWIHAPVVTGKASGAYAHPTVPSAHPYVLLNYQGKARDVMTLAHELGHGVHQVLAAPQGALMAPTPLTLAETASVFGEMLTFRRLLDATQDPRQRRALLASKVEDMINTVVRQIAFYSFERAVHLRRREGELTSEDLCRIWMEVQAESLGPAIALHSGYESFWAYISHFVHAPFYVYAYAFGDCLVNSLYAVYEQAHPRFVEHYFALLKAGGSQPYDRLLEPFGLDARSPAFWEGGLGVIERMIEELEGMG